MTLSQPVHLASWIEEHQHLLRPPVGNRTLVVGDDYIVQVVGGPNARTDYHVDPYEEWFYQLKGSMHVDVIDSGGTPRRIEIREGETWLLPRFVPHSPQRPEAGSIGLVVERVREDGLLEKFQWYCPECCALVHEVELQVRDIVKDLPPVFAAFYADERARTCPKCGALHPGKNGPATPGEG
jgi:3-hydroxyanthranilate 3,4-dioxygenase